MKKVLELETGMPKFRNTEEPAEQGRMESGSGDGPFDFVVIPFSGEITCLYIRSLKDAKRFRESTSYFMLDQSGHLLAYRRGAEWVKKTIRLHFQEEIEIKLTSRAPRQPN